MRNLPRFLGRAKSKISLDTLVFGCTILCGSIVAGDAYMEGTIAQSPSSELTTENIFALRHLKSQYLYSANVEEGLAFTTSSTKRGQSRKMKRTQSNQNHENITFYFHQK